MAYYSGILESLAYKHLKKCVKFVVPVTYSNLCLQFFAGLYVKRRCSENSLRSEFAGSLSGLEFHVLMHGTQQCDFQKTKISARCAIFSKQTEVSLTDCSSSPSNSCFFVNKHLTLSGDKKLICCVDILVVYSIVSQGVKYKM